MKWKNILLAILFIASLGVMVKDFYMLTIYTIFTGNMVGLTWLGLIELILAITCFISILEYFKDEIRE
jgi:uncharacterized membrane protein